MPSGPIPTNGVTGNVTKIATDAEALGISPTGHVVGVVLISASNITSTNLRGTTSLYDREISYFNGVTTSFGTFELGNESIGYGINAAGQVVGASEFQTSLTFEAVVNTAGAFRAISPQSSGNSSFGLAINKFGHVAGWSDEAIQISTNRFQIVPKAILWEGGLNPIFLNDLTNKSTGSTGTTSAVINESEGLALNDSNQVAGWSYTLDSGLPVIHACVMYNAVKAATDLGTLAGSNNPAATSEATGINNAGDVCGFSTSSNGTFEHAFLAQVSVPNSMQDLGVLAGESGRTSFAEGINNSGTVVGYADINSNSQFVAMVWTVGAGMQDLNTLATGAGNWVMEEATAVNDSGQIVGLAVNSISGVEHGFLLTPASEATPPTVSPPPSDVNALVGQDVSIASNITGSDPLTFQWFQNGVAITNPTLDDNTHDFSAIQLSDSGNYSVVATNLVGTVTTRFNISVVQPATITTQPANAGAVAGRTATISIGAVGTGTLTYQWQSSSDNITWTNVTNAPPFSGANGPTLTISPTTLAMNQLDFRSIVNNIAGIANTSNVSVLAVGVPPVITIPPGNLTINQGFNGNLTVNATATPPFTVQWSHAGTPVTGANTTATGNNSIMAVTSVLPLTNAQTATGGGYSVVVTNPLGSTVANANVVVILLPNITKQPANVGITVGKNATFAITATGTTPLTYQWQSSIDGGNTWSPIVNDTTFTGATTPSLALANATLTMNAEEFRCVVNNPSNIAVPSNAATLTVGVPPTINTGPLTQAVNQGSTTTTLSVLASGTAPLAYQWKLAGQIIPGATASSFTIAGSGAGIQAVNAGNYSVVVSNAVGNATASANVSVIILPVITSQPANSTLIAGKATSFKVTATGSPTLTYQWQQSTNGGSIFSSLANVAPFSGVNTPTLAISNATLAMNGTLFQVVVNNPSGVANTSIPALLSTGLVPTIAIPATDGIGNHTINQGALITLSVNPSGTAPFTYVWKHGTTVLSSTTNSLTITSPQAADAGAYSVVITNAYGNVTSTGNLTVVLLPAITVQPAPSTVVANKATSFKVTATGTPTLTYQWQQSTNGGSSFSNLTNTPPFSGVTTPTLAISNATLTMNGTEYQVVVNNAANPPAPATSIPALLSTGLVPTIATAPDGIGNHTINQGASITLLVNPSGTAPFTYVWKHGTTILSSTTNSLTIASPQAADAGAYSVVITNAYGNVTSTGNLSVTLLPVITSQPLPSTVIANKATSFKVTATGTPTLTYQWESSSSISGPFVPVINSSTISGNNTPTLAISNATLAMNGTYFAVAVNNPSGVANTSIPALLSTGIIPIITTAPGNQTANQGTTAVFTVAVSGNSTAPLSYQWSLGTSTIDGATSPTLSIPNVQSVNAGKYSVSVSNPYGAALASANLTVINLAAIATQPVNQTIIAGKAAAFKVTATGTPTLTYQWQSSPDGISWSNLTNGGAFAGVTTPSMSIPSTTLAMNGTQYRAIVNNGANPPAPATSSAALLSVGNPPVITSLTPANLTINQGNSTTFTVALTANSTSPLTYQWTVSGATLGSATGPTLNIPSAQASDSGKYSVLVTNAWGNASASTNLTVILLPVVNSGGQPASFAAAVGKSATFTVSAAGTGPLVYQWQISTDGGSTFANIASTDTRFTGAATASLKVGTTTFAMNGWQFRVNITNSSGVITTSSNATLTVGNPPLISSPPTNKTVTVGTNVAFSVSATGDPTLTYQWSLGATPLSDAGNVTGSATSTLNLATVQTTDAGNYFVKVSNAYGNASAQAMLTVNAITPGLVSGSSSGGTGADTGAGSNSSSNNLAPSLAEPAGFTITSGDLASVIIVPGSTLTPADVSSELLAAMNLNAASDVTLLPATSTATSANVNYAVVQFRQAKTAAGLALTVQYGYATADSMPATWSDVPASGITQLPNADASTSVYQARIPVPQGESVYFRISTTE